MPYSAGCWCLCGRRRGNNGKIYSYNYGTVASGSLGFNADRIATNDKFCCYIAGNSTGRANIKDKQLLLIGWMFDLYFNHNGTGEQNPSSKQFWQATANHFAQHFRQRQHSQAVISAGLPV